jgi:hypothetical protein
VGGERSPEHADGVGDEQPVAQGEYGDDGGDDEHDERAGDGRVEHSEGAEKEGQQQRDGNALRLRDNDRARRRELAHFLQSRSGFYLPIFPDAARRKSAAGAALII